MKSIAISIDEQQLVAIDRLRVSRGRLSRSECLREAIDVYLAQNRRRKRERSDGRAYVRYGRRLDRELAWLVREQAGP